MQQQAVSASGSCVVLAGPGSGKTKTMALKIGKLIQREVAPPQGLACLTFSTETVREIRKRIRQLELGRYSNLFVGTVHGFCLSQILMVYGPLAGLPSRYKVASKTDQRQSMNIAVAKSEVHSDLDWHTWVPVYRKNSPDRGDRFWTANPDLARVSVEYEKELHRRGVYDFDDQVLMALRLLESNEYVRRSVAAKFPWVVVDEYQDLGYPLHRLVTCLLDTTDCKLFAVGDPDQSIYSFQGANPQFLQDLCDRPDIQSVRLENNYRSTKDIVETSQTILGNDRGYRSARDAMLPGRIFPPYGLWKSGFAGQLKAVVTKVIPYLTDKQGVRLGEIAILALDKFDADKVSSALAEANIPFVAERDAKYDRTPLTRWLEDIAAWCDHGWTGAGLSFTDLTPFWHRLLDDLGELDPRRLAQHNTELFQCLIQFAGQDIDLGTWVDGMGAGLNLDERLSRWAQGPEEWSAWQGFRAAVHQKLAGQTLQDFAGKRDDRVVLTTFHSSKGLEYDAVILLGLENGRLPRYNATADQTEEARRLFYVALTRAKRFVFLFYSGWYNVETRYGTRRFEYGPSPFLDPLLPHE